MTFLASPPPPLPFVSPFRATVPNSGCSVKSFGSMAVCVAVISSAPWDDFLASVLCVLFVSLVALFPSSRCSTNTSAEIRGFISLAFVGAEVSLLLWTWS